MFRLTLPAVAALLVACGSSAWKTAHETDTADAYRDFLRNHPDDPNADAARDSLADKEFEAASKQHSLLAYKRFLDEFPDSPKAPAARALLEGLRFNAAEAEGSVNGWRQFLRDHPDGAHREEAERRLAEAEFQAAGPGADPSALARLVREHPDDPRRLELQTRLDDQAFDAAKQSGAFALYDYLRTFPAGAHREQAQAELFALKVEGLLASGMIEQAKQELQRSPLTASLPDLPGRVRDAEAQKKALASTDNAIRAAQASYYLRSIEDLDRALTAPDPLDRWQAAEELGQHVSVAAIDPLLNALRTARNALIRQRAFESLRGVLHSLPPRVADYEVASRLQTLNAMAGSAETWTLVAVLLDVSGRLDAAAAEYQRAWDKNFPDPVILRRWVEIRKERKQPFSAAVAARQLSLWAYAAAQARELPSDGGRVAVSDARELCAAAENARYAMDAIRLAKGVVTDFPDDVAQFELTASDALRLSEARLKDVELALKSQDPNARTCSDRRVQERLTDAEQKRAAAVRLLLDRASNDAAQRVLKAVEELDPSPRVRSLAASTKTFLRRTDR